MTAADDQLREANWGRMREALNLAAKEYRRVADDLDQIPFDGTAGVRRSPDAIIGQAVLTGNPGRIHADMINRLALWAESINEINRHAAASQRCGYRIDDPATICVLAPGHTLPTADGLVVHVSADGVKFA